MSIDQSVLLWCLIGPAVIALITVPLALWIGNDSISSAGRQKTAEAHRKSIHRVLSAARLTAAVGWWLATATALWGRQGWSLWPEDAWHQAIWPILLFAAALAATLRVGIENSGGRWVVAALLASGIAMVTMPSGEGWTDMLPLHRTWIPAVLASCLVNAWAIDRLAQSGGERWSLWVVLAGLAAATLLAASTYGALAEWGLAAIAVTSVLAVAASLKPFTRLAVAAAYPAVATSASIAASAHFYSYEEHPWWVSGLILFLPLIVVIIDHPLRQRNVWLRVVVAAIAASILIAIIGAMLFLGGSEESW